MPSAKVPFSSSQSAYTSRPASSSGSSRMASIRASCSVMAPARAASLFRLFLGLLLALLAGKHVELHALSLEVLGPLGGLGAFPEQAGAFGEVQLILLDLVDPRHDG